MCTVNFKTMNIELTNRCPLHCPQCYCNLEGGKNIPLEKAEYWVEEASKNGVETLDLSGGETLCYPQIYELIEYASKRIKNVNVALSGSYFDQQVYERLIGSGISGIFISLNGSTKDINSLTRDGYELAINALELLKENNFGNTYINWVMHSNNAEDFENMILLSEKYNVKNLVIMAFKPDANHELMTFPSFKQMQAVADAIKSYRGSVKLMVESCFSPMLALISDTKLFGNLNVGENKGCLAGRKSFSVNVDGLLSPCRHLDFFEKFDTLEDYWNNSEILRKIRSLEDNKKDPCKDCRLGDYCRHCLAINAKLHNDIFIGFRECPIHAG